MKNHLITAVVAIILTGCASVYDKKAESDHLELQDRTSKANAQLRADQSKPKSVVVDNVPRFTRQSIPFQSTQLLPAHIGKVTLKMPGRQNMPTIANLIERLTNIPVTIAPDALLPMEEFYPVMESSTAVTSKPTVDNKQAKNLQKNEDAKTQIVNEGLRKAGGPKYWKPIEDGEPGLEMNYQGSLAGLLDLVAMHNEMQWIYTNGKIHFFRVVTRTLQVKTLPAAAMDNISSSSGGDSSKSSKGAGKGDGKDDVLEGLEKTLRGMLSKRGKLQIEPSMGTVTVTDSFTNVQAMERHLDSVNRQLTRQVALTVEVLQVNLSN